MNDRIKQLIRNPFRLFFTLGHRGWLRWMSDRTYLKIAYRIRMGKKLHIDPPETFNEKVQWLKLYDRRPLYTTLVDKYAVKQWVADKIGEAYVIPTLGVWDRFDEIDFDALPRQFVLKCTHDSGGLVICRDKATFDKKAAEKKINRCLKHNFFDTAREWPYKDVKPRIIAETYMEDPTSQDLKDYKLFAFDGEVKALFIATNRFGKGETRFDFFDRDFHHLDFTNGHPNAPTPPAKPQAFEEMCALAGKLADGIPQVRVDFYEVDGKVYFGEMTFAHWSGMTPFEPAEWDHTFGSWITLPDKTNG